MRVGQKNGQVYQWARKGSRPRQPKDQRYENAYLFGAVCPERGTGTALIMPRADTEAMQKHLDGIASEVAPGAHGLVILDQAGWHTTRKLAVPGNLTLVPLPPASPELNAQENVWRLRPPPDLSLKSRLRQLHRHPRRLPARLAKAPRRNRTHRIHRNTPVDHHRSITMKAGIT
jgi:hypothetical protein